MTPALLADYLRVLRQGNAMSAELKMGEDELRVVLGPEMPDEERVTGFQAAEPGGWKAAVWPQPEDAE